MIKAEQVEKQLQEDFEKFQNLLYLGKIDVPKDIVAIFKKGIMSLAPHFHQVLGRRIKNIASKKPLELTNSDIHVIVKVIVNTPIEKLYGEDFLKSVDKQEKFEIFILSYNDSVNEFQAKLQQKKTLLQSLSGSSVRNNEMKIIN